MIDRAANAGPFGARYSFDGERSRDPGVPFAMELQPAFVPIRGQGLAVVLGLVADGPVKLGEEFPVVTAARARAEV